MVAGDSTDFGTDPETRVVAALGELGGIWPRSVMDDVERVA